MDNDPVITYYVHIVNMDTDEVVEKIPCTGEREAQKVERGVLINLNRDSYFTRIVRREV